MLKHYFYILLSLTILSSYIIAMEERGNNSSGEQRGKKRKRQPSRSIKNEAKRGQSNGNQEQTQNNNQPDLEDRENQDFVAPEVNEQSENQIDRASEERMQQERQTLSVMYDLITIDSGILEKSFLEIFAEHTEVDVLEKYLEYKKLIDQPIDLNGRDEHGRTAVYLAAVNDNEQLLDTLATHGADVNIADNYGLTPLYFSITEEYPNILRCLIKHKVRINQKTGGGTALHAALFNENPEIAKILLDNGADMFALDDDSTTPCKMVIDLKNPDLIKIFGEILINKQSTRA